MIIAPVEWARKTGGLVDAVRGPGENAARMDQQYRSLPSRGEREHGYGPNVHLLSRPYLMTRLARFCSPETKAAEAADLARTLFEHLAAAVADGEFGRSTVRLPTRMSLSESAGFYEGEVVDPATSVVCASILRAGSVPSQSCFETFSRLAAPENVRQDFLVLNRRTEGGRVTGADLTASKIGGSLEGRLLIVADPMGATGGTLLEALRHYEATGRGRPRRAVSVNLVVTPEFVRRIREADPEIRIYAIRLDRGMSDPDVLRTVPGTHPARERGLNGHQYVVPGAGGIGEMLNNAEE